MAYQLTAGICERLNTADQEDAELWQSTPTLQFLSIKKISSAQPGGGVDRYRIIISDGVHFLQAMLATPLNEFVEQGLIGKNTVAVVERMSCNIIQGKRCVLCQLLHAFYRLMRTC